MRQRRAVLSLLAAASLGASALSRAEEAAAKFAKIGIVSRVGDSISIVRERPSTGSRTQASSSQSMAVNGPGLDHQAMASAEDALARARPGVPVVLLAVPSAGSALDPAQLLAQEGANVLWPENVKAGLQSAGISHLLILAKQRAAARMRFEGGTAGKGQLEGLGFYLDNSLPNRNVNTGEHGIGYMAAYVYLKLVLVEVASGKVLGQKALAESSLVSASQGETGARPWEVLDSAQKLALLSKLMQSSLAEGVPGLLESMR